jgi:hypothetical protein
VCVCVCVCVCEILSSMAKVEGIFSIGLGFLNDPQSEGQF